MSSSGESLDPGQLSWCSGGSVGSTPLTVSMEELCSELSLMGFSRLPQQRLLQFKQDLEYLMQKRAALKLSIESLGDAGRGESEATPSSDASGWQPPASGLECAPRPTEEPYRPGPSAAPLVTRKVLRRNNEGQLRVCDESLLCSQDSRASSAEPPAVRSFIRLPPRPLLEQYRQRSDPVSRYQDYKQSWDSLQGALDKSRKELRWGVRERMMSAPPLPLPRALPAPNSYVIPTEKKRYSLRWAVRQDLVHGNVPRGDC